MDTSLEVLPTFLSLGKNYPNVHEAIWWATVSLNRLFALNEEGIQNALVLVKDDLRVFKSELCQNCRVSAIKLFPCHSGLVWFPRWFTFSMFLMIERSLWTRMNMNINLTLYALLDGFVQHSQKRAQFNSLVWNNPVWRRCLESECVTREIGSLRVDSVNPFCRQRWPSRMWGGNR